ncbi:methyl-accepting chemotaxis protein [Nocardioides sp. CER19]|uniref:methyl-accepting chemotaxis protein n=1 Tax=Nocardioides sp. CER19 TaxID=3038538 RepID=UPI00244AC601|nr:methyl-accepting chemotaxis protein [Nocardioides sp. CER19]MDH2413671.1 methyl-accepting chemotaxis protein [Nocardioides sp. CER19]
MSIGRRLTVAFGLICVLLAIVAVAGATGGTKQENLLRDTNQLQSLRDDVQELRYLDSDISGWQGYIYAEAVVEDPVEAVAPDNYNVQGLTASRNAVYALLNSADRHLYTTQELAELDHIRDQWDDYFTINDAMVLKIRKGSKKSMAAAWDLLNNDLDTAWSDLLDSTDKLAKSLDARQVALAHRSAHTGSVARAAVLGTAVLALLTAILLSIVVTRSIVRPLRRSVDALTRVADGDLTASPGIDQGDEVGRLAAAFDASMASLRGIVSTLAESADTLSGTAAGIERTTARISGSAVEASAGATEVSSAAGQVSENVQTVAAASEQMGASIQEIARSAQHAVGVVAEAVREAETTRRTIDQLGQSSEEIGNVVKLISSIAEQTNLLALNATIEAARAGEAGKGFAVVASEVKDLAQETAKATDDISQRVGAIQADASGAVAAIDRIGEVVTRISDSQNTIAAAVEEQSVTTKEMNRSVSDAAGGTGEIAAAIVTLAGSSQVTTDGVHEISAAVGELSRMSGRLQELVATFRYE